MDTKHKVFPTKDGYFGLICTITADFVPWTGPNHGPGSLRFCMAAV